MVAFYPYILTHFAALWWHKNLAASATEVLIIRNYFKDLFSFQPLLELANYGLNF